MYANFHFVKVMFEMTTSIFVSSSKTYYYLRRISVVVLVTVHIYKLLFGPGIVIGILR